MKKILYLYSDAGGCHRIAAEAIAEAIDEKYEGQFFHRAVEIWSLGSGLQKNLFGGESYERAIKFYPALYGFFFWLTNISLISSIWLKLNYPRIGRGLKKLIEAEKPDLIVSTHPMINHFLIRALKELRLYGRIPTVNVELELVTVHRFWIEEGFDMTFVPTEEAKAAFIRAGHPPEKIRLLGFPVRPKFLEPLPDRAVLRKGLGLSEDKFTILIMGGVEGVGDMYGIVKELSGLNREFQVIVCAGLNEDLHKQLKNLRLKFPLRSFGFTKEIPSIMKASDLLLTKAGAASVSEAIQMRLPMIIYSRVPGQEEGTPKWVEKNGFGKYVKDPKEIAGTIGKWMEANEIEKYKGNIKRSSDPGSTFEIAEEMIRLLLIRPKKPPML